MRHWQDIQEGTSRDEATLQARNHHLKQNTQTKKWKQRFLLRNPTRKRHFHEHANSHRPIGETVRPFSLPSSPELPEEI